MNLILLELPITLTHGLVPYNNAAKYFSANMCDNKKEDNISDIPQPDINRNNNSDANSNANAVDPPDIRIEWGPDGSRPRILFSSAARGRYIARTNDIRRQEYIEQHGRDYPSFFELGCESEGGESSNDGESNDDGEDCDAGEGRDRGEGSNET
jgi:hypothetical protein